MSFVCFERADALRAQEEKVRAIQVTDADSLCAYMKGFFELIYTHKMYGYVYDIYADNASQHTSNGQVFQGIPAIEHEIMKLCAAFPNMTIDVADIFAVPNGENAYKIWMRYYFHGQNSCTSMYGAPSGLKLEGDKALSLTTLYVEKVEDEWLIVKDMTHLPQDYIRGICTGDFSFTHVCP